MSIRRGRLRSTPAGLLAASLLAVGCRWIVGIGDHDLARDGASGAGGIGAEAGNTSAGDEGVAGDEFPGTGGSSNGGSQGTSGNGGAAGKAGSGGTMGGKGGAGGNAGAGGAGGSAGSGGVGGATGGSGGVGGNGGTAGQANACTVTLPACQDTEAAGVVPTAIATSQQLPTSVRIDDTFVYWINESDGQNLGAVMRVDRVGGQPVALASGLRHPRALLRTPAASAWVFFTDDLAPDNPTPGLYKVQNVPGGQVVAVDRDGLGAAGAVAIGGYAYTEAWGVTGPTEIRKSDLAVENGLGGCYPVMLGGRLAALSADSANLYFVEAGGARILRSGLGSGPSCAAASSVFVDNQPDIVAVKPQPRVDRNQVFWLRPDGLRRLAKDDPNGQPLCVAAASDPRDLTISDRGVVFTNAGDGTIRMPANGTRFLVCGQAEPNSIAVNESDEALTWTNLASGEVMLLETW